MMETHFRFMLGLMMMFFFVNIGLQMMAALHVPAPPDALTMSHDAFLECFGIAMGIFRGMMPQGGQQ